MSLLGQGVFVTGTDTGVGKTVAAAAVLTLLRSGKVDAVPAKPVQSGGFKKDGKWRSPDLDFCLRMSQMGADEDEYRLMTPYVLEMPSSPHLAAAREGRTISLDRIASSCRDLLKRREFLIVEGAGGVMVPIAGEETMLDLMVALGIPIILVSRPALGTLNHTLLSIGALRRAGLHVAGVIFCEAQRTQWGEIEQNNWETIERLGKVGIIGRIPYMVGLEEGEVSPDAFRELVIEHLLSKRTIREEAFSDFYRMLGGASQGQY